MAALAQNESSAPQKRGRRFCISRVYSSLDFSFVFITCDVTAQQHHISSAVQKDSLNSLLTALLFIYLFVKATSSHEYVYLSLSLWLPATVCLFSLRREQRNKCSRNSFCLCARLWNDSYFLALVQIMQTTLCASAMQILCAASVLYDYFAYAKVMQIYWSNSIDLCRTAATVQ